MPTYSPTTDDLGGGGGPPAQFPTFSPSVDGTQLAQVPSTRPTVNDMRGPTFAPMAAQQSLSVTLGEVEREDGLVESLEGGDVELYVLETSTFWITLESDRRRELIASAKICLRSDTEVCGGSVDTVAENVNFIAEAGETRVRLADYNVPVPDAGLGSLYRLVVTLRVDLDSRRRRLREQSVPIDGTAGDVSWDVSIIFRPPARTPIPTISPVPTSSPAPSVSMSPTPFPSVSAAPTSSMAPTNPRAFPPTPDGVDDDEVDVGEPEVGSGNNRRAGSRVPGCIILIVVLILAAWIVLLSAKNERRKLTEGVLFPLTQIASLPYFLPVTALDAGMDALFICLRQREAGYFIPSLTVLLSRALLSTILNWRGVPARRARKSCENEDLHVKAMKDSSFVYNSILLVTVTHSLWIRVMLPWRLTATVANSFGFGRQFTPAMCLVFSAATIQLFVKITYLVFVTPAELATQIGVCTNFIVAIYTLYAITVCGFVRGHPKEGKETEDYAAMVDDGLVTVGVNEGNSRVPDWLQQALDKKGVDRASFMRKNSNFVGSSTDNETDTDSNKLRSSVDAPFWMDEDEEVKTNSSKVHFGDTECDSVRSVPGESKDSFRTTTSQQASTFDEEDDQTFGYF